MAIVVPRLGRMLAILAGIFLVAAGGLAIRKLAEPPFVATTPPPAASTAGGPVGGEAYRWRPVAIGGGGFMVGLSSDRAGRTLVARTDVHGAYIWRPDRDRWAQLFTAPAVPLAWQRPGGVDVGVDGIAVSPSDPQHLYAALKGTVLSSHDGGAHWMLPNAGPFPIAAATQPDHSRYDPILAVGPDDPDLVLLGTATNGVLRSADGGRTWRRVPTVPIAGMGGQDGSVPILLWFAPPAAGAKQVWASVPGRGMFISQDGGATFAAPASRGPVPAGLSAGTFAPDGTFYGADPDGKTIWRAQHGDWSDLVRQGVLPAGRYVTVAANPGSGVVFAFEYNGRARRSIDGGRTWQRLSTRSSVGEGDPPWLRIADQPFFPTAQVRFDPVVPDRLWIAAGTGMFHADVPEGATRINWVSQTRGIEELVSNDVVQQHGHAPLSPCGISAFTSSPISTPIRRRMARASAS